VGLVRPRKWQATIHDMLRCIPSISPQGSLDSYFDFIDSKVSDFENLEDALTLLELAIWKSKLSEINGPLTRGMRIQCHTDSVTMVTIIVPNIHSFLTDDDGGNDVVYGDNYDEGNEGDDNDDDEEDDDNEDDKEDHDDVNGSEESDDGDEGNNYLDDNEEDDGDGDGIDDNY
jgi:hypothetical protein